MQSVHPSNEPFAGNLTACRALSPAYMDRLGREAGMAEASGAFCGLSSARFRSPEHRTASPQGVRSIMMSSYTMGQDGLICASPPAATNSRWGGTQPWAGGSWCGVALSRGALCAFLLAATDSWWVDCLRTQFLCNLYHRPGCPDLCIASGGHHLQVGGAWAACAPAGSWLPPDQWPACLAHEGQGSRSGPGLMSHQAGHFDSCSPSDSPHLQVGSSSLHLMAYG